MIDIDLLVVHERRTNQRLTDQTITISYDDMTLSNAIADVTYSVSNTLGESCKPYVFRVQKRSLVFERDLYLRLREVRPSQCTLKRLCRRVRHTRPFVRTKLLGDLKHTKGAHYLRKIIINLIDSTTIEGNIEKVIAKGKGI